MSGENCLVMRSKDLKGVILAGGYGTRMGGVEKGLMMIHDMPQYMFLYKLLQRVTDDVILSLRQEQISLYPVPEAMTVVPDKYRDIGPMGGILTCLKQLRSPLLVLSCDLYRVEKKTLDILLLHRDSSYFGTVFYDKVNGYLQPLSAIYETSCIPVLENTVAAGDYSLHRMIKSNDFKILNTNINTWFENINY